MLKCHNNSLGRLLCCVDHHQISYQVLFCKKWYFYSLESLLFNLEYHEASYLSLFQKKADSDEISNFWLKSWVNSIFFNYVKMIFFHSLERLFFSPEHHKLSYLSPFLKKRGNFNFLTKIMIKPFGKMHIILLCQIWHSYCPESLLFQLEHYQTSSLSLFQ